MRRLARALTSRDTKQPSMIPGGIDAGFATGAPLRSFGRYSPGPQRVSALVNTYGGTEESVSWVYSCVSTISDYLAGYEWTLEDDQGRTVDRPDPALMDLLTVPRHVSPRMTYFDMMALTGIDLEIAGNSYWLKDSANLIGQPDQLIRIRPQAMKIATNSAGDVIGYVATFKGIQIAYTAEEIAHIKYPNPLDDYYGMGTVEALIREVEGELAISQHIVGFFRNGARISGVLVVEDTLTEPQWERIRRQFTEEMNNPNAAFQTLIVEKGMNFQPTTAYPSEIGVEPLSRIEKDRLLSGFGCPAPILGGILENANYKMEEAQHIMRATMTPKCIRVGEQYSATVIDPGWPGMNLKIHPKTSDPQSVRITRGRDMLGAGASVNESREEMGLAPSLDPAADQIVLPTTLMPVGITAPRKSARAPVNGRKDAYEGQAYDVSDIAELSAGNGNGSGDGLVIEPPDGFERRGEVKVPAGMDPQVVRDLLNDHARMLRRGVDVLRPAFTDFFMLQKARVMRRLDAFRRAAFADRKALTPSKLWSTNVENTALEEFYLGMVDELGADAIRTPARLVGSSIGWDVTHEHIAAARDRLGKLIVRINDTTRQAIAAEVETGMARGYSIAQIASGFADEGYRGIAGVFDEATAARAETIARTESAMIYNGASAAAYRDGGVTQVLISDGVDDAPCADADGSTWDLDEFEANPTEHPCCTRAGIPLVPEGAPDEGDTIEGDG